MARLLGTGKDPNGSIVEGQVVDSPYNSPEYLEVVEKGYAVPLPPEDAPGTSVIEVANAVVRGDTFESNPAAAKVSEVFLGAGQDPDEGVDPYAVVHAQDPGLEVERDTSGDAEAGPNVDEQSREREARARAARTGDRILGGQIPEGEVPSEEKPKSRSSSRSS